MNEMPGTVVRVDAGRAWVRSDGQTGGCGSCNQRGACGLNETQATGGGLICLPNTIHARVGDAIVIRASDGAVLHAAWRAYGLPLLLAIGGASGMMHATGSELGALAGLLAGLLAGVATLYRTKARDSVLSMGFRSIR